MLSPAHALLRRTAREVAEKQKYVQINAEAAKALGMALKEKGTDVQAAALKALTFPIKFETVESEVMHACMHARMGPSANWKGACMLICFAGLPSD